jgi:hypothetical protein
MNIKQKIAFIRQLASDNGVHFELYQAFVDELPEEVTNVTKGTDGQIYLPTGFDVPGVLFTVLEDELGSFCAFEHDNCGNIVIYPGLKDDE